MPYTGCDDRRAVGGITALSERKVEGKFQGGCVKCANRRTIEDDFAGRAVDSQGLVWVIEWYKDIRVCAIEIAK